MKWRGVVVVLMMFLAGCAGEEFDEPGTVRNMAEGDDFIVPRGGSGHCAIDYRSQVHLLDRNGELAWTRDVPWVMAEDAIAVPEEQVIGVSPPLSKGAPQYVFSLSLSDGSPRWQRALEPSDHHARPPVVDDVVIVGDGPRLVGLEVSSGKERWRVDEELVDLVVTPVGLVALTLEGDLLTIDPATGETATLGSIGFESGGALISTGDELIVVEDGRFIVALDLSSGKIQWEDSLDLSSDQRIEIHWADPVLLAATEPVGDAKLTPQIVALVPNTGEELWRHEGRLSRPGEGVAVLSLDEEGVQPVVIDLLTGEERWTLDVLNQLGRVDWVFDSFVGEPNEELLLMSVIQVDDVPNPDGLVELQSQGIAVAMNAADGSVAWRRESGELTLMTANQREESLVLGYGPPEAQGVDGAGLIEIVRPADGHIEKRHNVREPVWAAPIVAGDQLVVLSSDRAVFCD